MQKTRMFILLTLACIAAASVFRLELTAKQVSNQSGNNSANSANADDQAEPTVVKTYAVPDLVVAWPMESTFKFNGSRWSSITDAKPGVVHFGDLNQLIMDTISPNSWESKGGIGRIEDLETSMSIRISHNNDVQARVAALLDRLRELTEVTIIYRGFLVVLPPNDYKNLQAMLNIDSGLLSARDARSIQGFALGSESTRFLKLPQSDVFNGQACTYQISKLGGIESASIVVRGVVSPKRDSVNLLCAAVANHSAQREAAQLQRNVNNNQYAFFDLSGTLSDQNHGQRVILVLQSHIINASGH